MLLSCCWYAAPVLQAASDAARFPEDFSATAAAMDVDATAGAGAVDAVDDALRASFLRVGVASIVLAALIVGVQLTVIKIVTPYEILHGLLQYLTVLQLAQGVAVVALGAGGLVYASHLGLLSAPAAVRAVAVNPNGAWL